MTDSVHPTPDELADLQADLLTGADLARVQAHVGNCPDCTAELAALDEVSALLAEAGSETLTMPVDVAADLDEAITTASRERAAGVTSLAAKRAASSQSAPRRTRWVLMGGAAAAAVVVIGAIALSGLDGMQSGSDDSSAGGAADSAGDAGADTSGQSEADSPNDGQEYAVPSPSLTPDSVARYASKIAAKKGDAVALRSMVGCTTNLPEPTNSARATAYLAVKWEGEPAVLVVDKASRTATVFGCGTGAEPLYSTSY